MGRAPPISTVHRAPAFTLRAREKFGSVDDTGTKEFNESLAQQRAEAVRRWLVSKGIDAKRLAAKGYGARVPIDSNTTDEGRQKNRRVQFVITQTRK